MEPTLTHCAKQVFPHVVAQGLSPWAEGMGTVEAQGTGESWQGKPALVAVGCLPEAVTLTCVFSSSVTRTQT